MTKRTYPYPVESTNRTGGKFTVQIYNTAFKRPDGSEQESYTLVWYEAGKRQRKQFASFDDGEKHALTIANTLAGNEIKISAADARVYHAALASLRECRVPLDDACDIFARVWKLTNGKPEKAAHDFASRDNEIVIEKSVADAITEYLVARKVDISSHFYREFDCKLNALAKDFVGPMTLLEPHRIDNYIRHLTVEKRGTQGRVAVSSRTKKNTRSVIMQFLKWSKSRHYLPKAYDYNEAVSEIEVTEGDIEIYTVDEMRNLLSNTPDSLVPFVAIGAFAGLRHAEIGRLDWSQVNFKRKHIEVKAKNAKTRSRRLVPLAPVLEEWLRPFVKTSGRVCIRENMGDALLKLARKAKMDWRHNALRHSYISYRVAETQNVDQVALEAGNSPAKIFSNYRELVDPDAAKAWFNLYPKDVPRNVINLEQEAAA